MHSQAVTRIFNCCRGGLTPESERQVRGTLMWLFVPGQGLRVHYSGNIHVTAVGFPRGPGLAAPSRGPRQKVGVVWQHRDTRVPDPGFRVHVPENTGFGGIRGLSVLGFVRQGGGVTRPKACPQLQGKLEDLRPAGASATERGHLSTKRFCFVSGTFFPRPNIVCDLSWTGGCRTPSFYPESQAAPGTPSWS